MGYNKWYHDALMNKLMKDSGFEKILDVAKTLPQPENVAPQIKEAFNLKEMLASGALMGTLMSPMAHADEAALLAAQRMSESLHPQITQELQSTLSHLGPMKRMGANAYGVENIAKELAKGKGNLQITKQFGLPISEEGAALEEGLKALQGDISATGDVDISKASNLYDQLKGFNSKAEEELLKYVPRSVASR
jgi:hypothetical protein